MIASKAQCRSLMPPVAINIKIWTDVAGNASLLAILLVLTLIAIPSAWAQTFTVLHEFIGAGDGAEPLSGVIHDAAGNLYGVTNRGGSFNYGTVFRLDPTGKESQLHSFIGGEGLGPNGGLLLDSAAHLYGTTTDGGAPEGGGCAHGCGTIFKRDTAGNQTILYAFTGKTDGGAPNAALIRDAAGNLYGTTTNGGIQSCYVLFGCGVIFKLDTANHETVLYRFTDGTDGKMPEGVVADAAGNLYGTTYDGGTLGIGTIFKLDPTGTLTELHSFTGGSDSSDPSGHLIMDSAGNLYGTTNGAFSTGYGIVFKLDTAANFTVLYTFTGGVDGSYPNALVLDKAGNLYGAAFAGGTGSGCYYGSCGIVFKLDTSGTKTVLHSFSGADGQLPNGLTMDKAGNLYGTTLGGGKGSGCTYYHGCGTVFKLTP
jgi:uncharacterized repeat protein (TIGR03803 family)